MPVFIGHPAWLRANDELARLAENEAGIIRVGLQGDENSCRPADGQLSALKRLENQPVACGDETDQARSEQVSWCHIHILTTKSVGIHRALEVPVVHANSVPLSAHAN
jgi:hypothetical protein